MKLQIIPAKSTKDSQELEKLTEETLAISKKNDSALTDEEKENIKKADKLTVQEYPLIFPLRATIGHMVRNMDGKNHQAIEFIRASLPANAQVHSKNFMFDLVSEFDSLDEASQNRVDCLDHLSRRNKIGVQRFLAALAEGIEVNSKTMTKMLIAAKRPDLVGRIFDDAMTEKTKSTQNKNLASKIAGVVESKPSVVVDQSTNVTRVDIDARQQVVSFADFQKNQDKQIRGKRIEDEVIEVEGKVVNE